MCSLRELKPYYGPFDVVIFNDTYEDFGLDTIAHATTMLQEDQETILQGCLTPRSRKTELAIADERRARKMEIEALKMQLRDSQEKTEVAVARGENMTMKILDLQDSLIRERRWCVRREKELKETRAERDAAREDAQKKTATIAERDERIASLEHCIANIEFHCDATHGA